MKRFFWSMALFFFLLAGPDAGAQVTESSLPVDSPPEKVGVDEKLGEKIPLDITFNDEEGSPHNLGDLIGGKPTLLTMVYYHCPGVCTPYLSEMARLIEEMPADLDGKYHVLTVSFDENESAQIAKEKKTHFTQLIARPFPEEGWSFLTGSKENSDRLADAIGFRFQRVDNDFLHTTALVALSPTGEVIRYLYGKSFLPFDVNMALVEASKGRVGPTINKVLQYCFSFDPAGKSYTFNLLRVLGSVVLGIVVILVIYLYFQGRRRKREMGH